MITCKKCRTSWHMGEKGCPFCHAKGQDNILIEQEYRSYDPEYIAEPRQESRAALTKQRIGIRNGAVRIRKEALSS